MENSTLEILIWLDITRMQNYTIGNYKIKEYKHENVGLSKLFQKGKHDNAFMLLQSSIYLNVKLENIHP